LAADESLAEEVLAVVVVVERDCVKVSAQEGTKCERGGNIPQGDAPGREG